MTVRSQPFSSQTARELGIPFATHTSTSTNEIDMIRQRPQCRRYLREGQANVTRGDVVGMDRPLE